MPPRFHAPHLTVDADQLTLDGDEARHLTRVLRLGRRVNAARELPFALTLVQAVLKGDAMDGIVRDATMLGVTAIQPIVTDRSELSIATLERRDRRERWQRIAISSAKQCRRAVVPAVVSARGLADALERSRGSTMLMLTEPSAGVAGPPACAGDRIPAGAHVFVFAGPEGGWSEQEISQAAQAGARFVTLGDRTLRAEAVALIALPVLLFAWGEL